MVEVVDDFFCQDREENYSAMFRCTNVQIAQVTGSMNSVLSACYYPY